MMMRQKCLQTLDSDIPNQACGGADGDSSARLRTRRGRLCLPALLALASWLLVGPVPAYGQQPLGPVEQGSMDTLLTLPGDTVVGRYAPGALDRAARLQVRLMALHKQLNDWQSFKTRLGLFVLDQETWTGQKLARPYGFPVRVGPLAVAVPAWGNAATVTLWQDLLGPVLAAAPDFSVRGTPQEVATVALADTFAQLEMCRAYIERQRLTVAAEPWLADILAHAVCITADREGPLPPAVDLVSTLEAVASRVPPATTLSGYEPHMELRSWLGYQARFAVAGELMWQEHGRRTVKKLFRLHRKKGSALTFGDLLDEWPQLRGWRAEAFAAVGS